MCFESESDESMYREEIRRLEYINRKLIEALEEILPELSASNYLFIRDVINDAKHGR